MKEHQEQIGRKTVTVVEREDHELTEIEWLEKRLSAVEKALFGTAKTRQKPEVGQRSTN